MKHRLLLAIACLFGVSASAQACNIPVFRYALERWRADPYEVLIYHRGPLDEATGKILDQLDRSEPSANVTVTAIDLDNDPEPNLVKLLKSEKNATFPWMVVRYPLISGIGVTVWSGPVSADNVKLVVDSPVRQELARRLLAGQSAVWLFLDSGDKDKDEAAFKLLEKEAAELPKMLKLPVLSASPDDELLGKDMPLKIAFSIIRLSRTQAKEAVLVKMLLLSEPELDTLKEPMAFPVFGRGRAHYALVGKGINRDNILDCGSFLVGPCSCEIKQLNPGVDLLVKAGWDEFLRDRLVRDKEPELIGLTAPPDPKAELIAAPAQSAAEAVEQIATPQPLEESVDATVPSSCCSACAAAEQNMESQPVHFDLYRNMALALGAGLALIGLSVLAFKGKMLRS
ncbi:MAG: hypothetical protein AB7K24_09160 [Gemmataceae bacterium]